MAKPIKLPDGTILKFPDDMPDEEIANEVDRYMAQNNPQQQQPITGGTSLNQQPQQDGSISGGVPLSGPMAMDNPIQAGGNVQAGQVNQVNLPNTPNPNYVRKPYLAERLASSAADGVSMLPGLPGDLINFLEADEEKYLQSQRDQGYWTGPSGRDIRHYLDAPFRDIMGIPDDARASGSKDIRDILAYVIPRAPFESPEGKIIGGAVSGFTGGLGIGGIPLALAGAVGGASQQGAAEAGANEYWQFGAGLLGGGLTGGAVNLAKSSIAQAAGRPSQGVVNLINEATLGVDPAKMAQARALQEASKTMGTPLTGSEAIAQATGGNNQLQTIQRVIEQSPKGSPIMERMMNQRVAGNDQAMQGVLNKIGQRAEDTGALGANVQHAAGGILKDAKGQVKEISKPLYEPFKGEKYNLPKQQYALIAEDEMIQDIVSKMRESKLFGPKFRNLPDNNLGVLDFVKKRIDGLIANEKDPFVKELLTEKKHLITSVADQAFPEYAMARQAHGQAMQNIVRPLENQPTGSLANTGDFNKQAAILLDPKASNMTPSVAKSTIENIVKQNPEAAQTMIRQSLENHFNEATQKVRWGDNQWGSSNFATNILGNKQQAENLKSLFAGLPEGSATFNDFRRLMDVFEAQGKRLLPGSSTPSVSRAIDNMGQGGLVNAALEFSTVQPLGFLKNWMVKLKAGKNARELANLLTNPRSVEIIQQLRKMPTTSPAAAALVFMLLQGQQAANP